MILTKFLLTLSTDYADLSLWYKSCLYIKYLEKIGIKHDTCLNLDQAAKYITRILCSYSEKL